MKKGIAIAAAALAITAAGYYYWTNLARDTRSAPAAAGAMPPAPVDVMAIEVQQINLFEELPGRVTAAKVAQIRPQVSGIITKRLFREGSDVTAGQQLYQIDAAPYKAAYNSAKASWQKAQANLKSAQVNADRYKELSKTNLVSKQQYDNILVALEQAKADVAVAEATIEAAEIDLNYTKVYAPISGRIGKSFVTEGALVTANQAQALTRVTQLDPIYVDLTQSSANLMRMREQQGNDNSQGLAVNLNVEGQGAPYPHQGTLQFSDITVDETTGSVTLRALMPNPDQTLLPGLFVRARIELGSKQAILVPQRAAVRGVNGDLSVWKVGPDNTVNPTPITTEGARENTWVISGGLQKGDVIVVAGFQRIFPGATVAPAPVTATNSRTGKNAAQ